MKTKPSKFEIFNLFLKLGTIAFGGGPALISIIEQEVVEKRKWLSSKEYARGLAISIIPPGPIMVNISFFVGYALGGFSGGALATVAILLPSFILMVIFGIIILKTTSLNLQRGIVDGVAPAVVGVVVALVLKMSFEHIKTWWGILLMVGTVLAVFYLNASPLILIFLAIASGVLFWALDRRRKRQC